MDLLKKLFFYLLKGLAWPFKKLYKSIFKATPRGKVRWAVFFVLLLAFLGANLDYPKYWNGAADWLNAKWEPVPGPSWLKNVQAPHFYDMPFHLGLDLQGGTHLVYEADVSNIGERDKGDAVEGARDVIERRVNAFGVAEPLVQTTQVGNKWRVVVELAGVSDVQEAIKMIGETPLLEFKEMASADNIELTADQQQELDDFNNAQKAKAEEAMKKLEEGEEDSKVVEEYSEGPEKEMGGILEHVRDDGPYGDLFTMAEGMDLNTVSNIIENYEGYNIIKPLEKSENEKEVNASHILICWDGAGQCESGLSKDDALKKIQELKEQATPDNFTELAKENSTEPGADESGGSLGWFGKGMMVPEFENAVMGMEKGAISDIVETQFGYHIIYKADERDVTEYKMLRVLLPKKSAQDIAPLSDPWKNTELSGKHLVKSQLQFNQKTNEAQVGLSFNDEGKKLFADITERNVGKPVAIFLDGMPISVPTVNEPITAGQAVITGNFNIKEAKLLAQRLNAGALPVPINLVSQQTVGASLGHESVSQSLVAGLVGILLVAIFMILFYRLPGLISVLALGIYGVLMLALFKVIGVTMTLSGIAGFILSVGMAVDANVLIFERLKEELRSGKSLISSVDEGFSRAWPSIRDGNVSTLITCLILATFSTSMVKGFAVTLGIGVLASMFSAIVITRIFLKLLGGWGIKRLIWLWGGK